MISLLLVAVSTIHLVSIILVLVLFLLGFKLLETTWSYKISKPYLWENAVKRGEVSRKVRRIERFYRDKVRFYTFWLLLERLKKARLEGCMAEVGVYKGETADLLHAMDPSRKLYLFDTFEGFAESDLRVEHTQDGKLKSINFADTSLAAVKRYVQGNENVKYYPGRFPESAREVPPEKFVLVHLDADLYQPTLEALKYFYPRLGAGGAIIVHDYNHTWEGVRRAVDEFAPTIPEPLTFIPDWQGSILITKSYPVASPYLSDKSPE